MGSIRYEVERSIATITIDRPDTGAGSWLLPRQMGLPAALRILYSGEFVSADEAYPLHEFFFRTPPLKFTNAVGSPINPLAVN